MFTCFLSKKLSVPLLWDQFVKSLFYYAETLICAVVNRSWFLVTTWDPPEHFWRNLQDIQQNEEKQYLGIQIFRKN